MKRPARIFDVDGNEVFVSLRCLHCGETKPLAKFGLRRMGDGKIRNCPWCTACRSNAQKPAAESHEDLGMAQLAPRGRF